MNRAELHLIAVQAIAVQDMRDGLEDLIRQAWQRRIPAKAIAEAAGYTDEASIRMLAKRRGVAPMIRRTVQDRFWAKVDVAADGCWNWTGALTNGYGRFGVAAGSVVLAYRWLWEQTHGPIPDGLQLDHLCRNRACVNPAHLEPVTPRENLARGVSWQRSKTHCKHGHAFTADNTHVDAKGHRYCRTCYRARAARYREEARHANPAA